MRKPLLLIDVDGVISLFGFDAGAPPPGRLALIDGHAHLLSQRAGTCCAAWRRASSPCGARAGRTAPTSTCRCLLGLPRAWPHVRLDRGSTSVGTSVAGHWKLAPIDAFAGPDRPLAWIDDVLDDACDAWAAARPGRRCSSRRTPAVGLTEAHEAAADAWLRAG